MGIFISICMGQTSEPTGCSRNIIVINDSDLLMMWNNGPIGGKRSLKKERVAPSRHIPFLTKYKPV